MESIYLGIVLFLFLLAIFDLVVGVSNDAVNFLGSLLSSLLHPDNIRLKPIIANDKYFFILFLLNS